LDKAPDAFRTISEVADDLKVPQHVLRFWESRFAQIKPMKRAGGRRYYRPDDVDLLRGIHHLLYGEGYTIRGVQRILKDQGVKFVEAVWQAGAEQPPHGPRDDEFESELDGDDTGPGDAEPAPHRTQVMESAPTSARTDLSREELRKLHTAMFELNECRRLLDAAVDPAAS
jgi:DNA-binding transcriptional MerR regulator